MGPEFMSAAAKARQSEMPTTQEVVGSLVIGEQVEMTLKVRGGSWVKPNEYRGRVIGTLVGDNDSSLMVEVSHVRQIVRWGPFPGQPEGCRWDWVAEAKPTKMVVLADQLSSISRVVDETPTLPPRSPRVQ